MPAVHHAKLRRCKPSALVAIGRIGETHALGKRQIITSFFNDELPQVDP